mgnify:FL=1
MATDTEGRASIPRMRTAAKIVAEIKAADPGTEVTEYYIRQLVKEGSVPVVWAGNKALINLDDILSLLRLGTSRAEPEPDVVGGIRRIEVDEPNRERRGGSSSKRERPHTQPAVQSV